MSFGAPRRGRREGSGDPPPPDASSPDASSPDASAKAAADLRGRAIRLIARREYSAHELQRRLLAAGGDEESVAALLTDLRTSGYLSDQRFADSTVRRSAGKFSRRHIAGTLKASGVERDVAEQAMAGVEQDDFDAAMALWRRRFGVAPADQREKARQVRFLLSRGFSTAVALHVLRAGGASVDDERG